MKKTLLLSVFCFLTLCSTLLAQNIGGFWKKVNEKTDLPECIMAVYEYQGKHYGRMIATYDESGKMTDTIYSPKRRMDKIPGNPFFCGMDFIWSLRNRGSRYKGKIVDPRSGSVYKAELWVRDNNLIVRGELLFFGKNVTWLPTVDSDFPKGFKKPDVSKFVPVIPESD